MSFKLETDVSRLFPYINAVIDDAVYYEDPDYIQFTLEGYHCGLYPRIVVARLFEGRERALVFAERLIDFLNDLHARMDSLKPNHTRFKPVPALEILKMLPGTNCQECGFLTCTAFAVALSRGKTVPEQCPSFEAPIRESADYPVYDNNGNLVSTLTIGIDTAKMRLDLEHQKENIKALRESLNRMEQKESEYAFDGESLEAVCGLTDREVEVLRLVAEGLTNTEISNSLFISPHTVKSHIIHIFNKLGVNDRTRAAVLATRLKMI